MNPLCTRFISKEAAAGFVSLPAIASSQRADKVREVQPNFPQNNHAFRPPPPPPPPPRPLEAKDSGFKTPAKSSQEKKKHVYFSPETTTYGEASSRSDLARRIDELYIAGPTMSILSPMSGVTNATAFNSPVATRDRRSVPSSGISQAAAGLGATINSIDMLNLDYIENCNTIDDLWHIIRLLKDPKNESTQLLEAAKDRVRTLHRLNGPPQPPPPPPPPLPAPPTQATGSPTATADDEIPDDVASLGKVDFGQGMANLSRITNGNTTLDSIDPSKSSLNFSLSPSSVLQGIEYLAETPSIAGPFFRNTSYVEGKFKRLLPIAESTSMTPSPAGPQFHNKEGRIQDMPGVMQNRSRGIGTLKILSNAESMAPRHGIDDVFYEGNRKTEPEWMEEFRKVHMQHQMTQKTLDLTRAELRKKDEDTRALEKRLESRTSELTKALSESAEKSRLVVGAERTIRIQCEHELSKQNRKNTELNKELRDMLENLEQMKRRHLLFRLDLLKATGMSNSELKNLSQHEFVSSLSKKMKTLKEENEKMAKCLEEAKRAIHDRDIMESKLNEAECIKENLVAENARLGEKIEELRAEVKSSRAYIDKLLQTSYETTKEDWEKQEEKYRSVIFNLRQQIRKQASVVSIDLYKDAKNESRKSLAELQIAEESIDKLTRKVAQLEKDNQRISKALRTPKGSLSKQSNQSIFFSPTDQLEKGLFPSSQEKTLCTVKTTPRTMKSSRKASQVVSEGDFIGSSSNLEKGKVDLTGMTISFRKGEMLRDESPSPTQKRDQVKFTRIAQSSTAQKKIGLLQGDAPSNAVLGDPNPMESLHQTANFAEKAIHSNAPPDGKENDPKSPRNESKTSPIERVRAYGGRRALQEKVRKMKMGSPKLLTSVGPRQVQVILH